MPQSVSLITLLLFVFAAVSSAANEEGTRKTQFVARFPNNLWGRRYCGTRDVKDARQLSRLCMQNINEDSPPEEKLACSIIAAPNSIGRIPFGMYSADTLLDTELTSLTTDSVSHVFSECALAQMIDDGCFTFDADLGHANFHSTSYQSESEYSSMVSNTYGVTTSVSAGFGPLTATASYNSQTTTSNSHEESHKFSSVSKSWEYNVGVLSMDTCRRDIRSFLSASYRKLWDDVADEAKYGKSEKKLVHDPKFQKIMQMGYYIPTSFVFAIRYNANIQSTFDASTDVSTSAMSEALSAAASAKVGNGSASVGLSMEKNMVESATKNNLAMTLKTHETKYGICDFVEALNDEATNWMNVFHDCAEDTANDLLRLDRAAYVPYNGFVSVFDLMEDKFMDKTLSAAVSLYFFGCNCVDPHSMTDNRFYCVSGDKSKTYYGVYDDKCSSTKTWYPVKEAISNPNHLSQVLTKLDPDGRVHFSFVKSDFKLVSENKQYEAVFNGEDALAIYSISETGNRNKKWSANVGGTPKQIEFDSEKGTLTIKTSTKTVELGHAYFPGTFVYSIDQCKIEYTGLNGYYLHLTNSGALTIAPPGTSYMCFTTY